MSRQAVSATLAVAMTEQKNNHKLAVTAIFAISVYFLLYVPAFAQLVSPIASVLCSVVNTILIDVGRGISTLAIIVLGISALMGRATWAQGLTIMAGIAIIFGAPAMAVGFAAAAVAGVPGLGNLFGNGVGNVGAIIACNAIR